MKVRLMHSSADWEITLKVIDRKAKRQRQKHVIYDFEGQLQTDGIGQEIEKALHQAEVEASKWKAVLNN